MFCKNCGTSMNDNEMFCPACGTKQDVAEQQTAPAFGAEATAEAKKAPFDIKGLTQHKLFKPLAAVIAVILVICIVVVPVLNSFGSAKEADFYLYATTKGELFVKYSKDKKGKEITDDIADVSPIYVAKKELLFYVENDDSTLYYVSLGKKELKPVKVDKDVDSFQVSSDGKTVWFKADGDLYVSNLKDSNKIESDVSSYYVNEKGTKCTYFVRDDKEEDALEAYEVISTDKKGKTKTVAENVSYAIGSSAEEEIVFYQDKETIYSVDFGANKGKKALEVADWSEDSDLEIVSVISANEFYYTVNEEIDAMDFISDSHDAEKDEAVEWGDEGYEEASARKYIRSGFEEDVIESMDLHYVKGGKDKGAVVSGVSYCDTYYEGQYIFASAQTVNKDAKINIDELVDAYNNYNYEDEDSKSYYEVFQDTVYGDYSKVLVIDGKANVIESAEDYDDLETSSIRVDEKGKTLYYYKDYDSEEDMAGTLYKRSISGSKLGNEKELYSEVYSYSVTEKGDVITLRDYDDGEATLYIDGKEVADDVSDFSFAQDGTILYETNAKGGTFTLNQVNGKKGVKIADDVCRYAALGKNDIMFIDEDMELFQYNKKSNKSIEDDVVGIMIIPEYCIV